MMKLTSIRMKTVILYIKKASIYKDFFPYIYMDAQIRMYVFPEVADAAK